MPHKPKPRKCKPKLRPKPKAIHNQSFMRTPNGAEIGCNAYLERVNGQRWG